MLLQADMLGCSYANKQREIEQGLDERCLHCRQPVPKTEEECYQNFMKRVKVNDPVAIFKIGVKCEQEGDFEGAMQHWKTAATLGEMDAHYNLSCMYREGRQGVEKDMKKAIYHAEEAAIGGHPEARFNLGCDEWSSGRYERAYKHYIIAAKQGYSDALEPLKHGFQTTTYVNKEDYEAALRGHQAAVDATKSEQRDAAYVFNNWISQQRRRL